MTDFFEGNLGSGSDFSDRDSATPAALLRRLSELVPVEVLDAPAEPPLEEEANEETDGLRCKLALGEPAAREEARCCCWCRLAIVATRSSVLAPLVKLAPSSSTTRAGVRLLKARPLPEAERDEPVLAEGGGGVNIRERFSFIRPKSEPPFLLVETVSSVKDSESVMLIEKEEERESALVPEARDDLRLPAVAMLPASILTAFPSSDVLVETVETEVPRRCWRLAAERKSAAALERGGGTGAASESTSIPRIDWALSEAVKAASRLLRTSSSLRSIAIASQNCSSAKLAISSLSALLSASEESRGEPRSDRPSSSEAPLEENEEQERGDRTRGEKASGAKECQSKPPFVSGGRGAQNVSD